jgi:sucrose phosphorylase
VPHAENVSYFGDGADEAQMVYLFSLAPLTLDAFHSGDARQLTRWAEGLQTPTPTTTFFNFTASHDGTGVRPAEGILDSVAFQRLVDKAQSHGGHVSFKTNSDGSKSPYELNISYFDALSDPAALQKEGLATQIGRFMASQAIMLSLAGVPGVYVHSLFGSRSYYEGVRETGRYRSINREKLRRAELQAALADQTSLRCQVFARYVRLLRLRTAHKAFHPNGLQKVLDVAPALFSLLRTSPDGQERVLCLHNVSDQEQRFEVSLEALGAPHGGAWRDLLMGERYPLGENGELAGVLSPYQVLWLKA